MFRIRDLLAYGKMRQGTALRVQHNIYTEGYRLSTEGISRQSKPVA
jgi:hypothetical protein